MPLAGPPRVNPAIIPSQVGGYAPFPQMSEPSVPAGEAPPPFDQAPLGYLPPWMGAMDGGYMLQVPQMSEASVPAGEAPPQNDKAPSPYSEVKLLQTT